MAEVVRVLMLEDNPDDAELIVRALRRAGFTLESQRVEDEAAYRAALQGDHDLILADHNLSTFNAVRALELLLESGRDLPFIIISGGINEELAVECMRRGAADYLLKDRLGRLGQAVEHALREKQMRADMRAAERHLRESEMKFKTIFNESLDVLLLLDSQTGHILDVNAAVSRIMHYDPASLLGQPFTRLFAPDVEPPPAVQHTLRTQSSIFASHPFLCGDGSICPMDLTATLMAWGEEEAVLVTLRDVTERQQADAALRAAELLHIELEKEREISSMRMSFLSMVSHEFRTPLATILSSSDLLRLYLTQLSDEQRAKHLHRIQDAVRNMVKLVDEVLMVGRFDSNRVENRPEAIPLTPFCTELVDQIRQTLTSGHQVSLVKDADLTVYADPSLLHQIIGNLLTNAVKYSPKGGEVTLDITHEPDAVTLSVRDQGIGIPSEDQRHIFGSFRRASNVGGIPGNGLGLSIVKKAVELMRGQVSLESEVGKGTTFRVRLPLETPPGVAATSSA
jgi:PAS domain S-box-containing protein